MCRMKKNHVSQKKKGGLSKGWSEVTLCEQLEEQRYDILKFWVDDFTRNRGNSEAQIVMPLKR